MRRIWIWILVGLVVLYLVAETLLSSATLAAFDSTGYVLTDESGKVSLDVATSENSSGTVAIIRMQSAVFGMKGSIGLSDGKTVSCRFFMNTVWCDEGWTLVGKSVGTRIRSEKGRWCGLFVV